LKLTIEKALGYAAHALDGMPDELLDAEDLLNMVGQIFIGSRYWNFLTRRLERLGERAPVSVTAATYTHATPAKTFTKAGAFASYDLVPGDYVTVTKAGATIAQVTVASKTDDTLVIQGTALAGEEGSSLDLAIDTARVPLPADFAGECTFTASASYNRDLIKVSPSELLRMRTQDVGWSGIETYAAIYHAKTGDAVKPVPVLEIWPAPTTADWDAFALDYRAGWVDVSGASGEVPIPGYAVPAFISMLRAYVQGLEEAKGGSPEERIAVVMAGQLYESAMMQDEGLEYDFGQAENTAWDEGRTYSSDAYNRALVWSSDTILPV